MKIHLDVSDTREILFGLNKIGDKFYIRANGGIHMYSTNNRTTIKASPKGGVVQAGEIAFESRQFVRVMKKLNKHGGNLTIETESDTNWLTCNHPELEFRMANKVDEVRLMPDKPDDWQRVGGDIGEDLEVVAGYASTDDARANITGVNFQMYKGNLTLVATDGHRLAKFERPDEELEIPNGNFTLQREACEVIGYIMGRSKTGVKRAYIGFIEHEGEGVQHNAMCVKFGRYEVYGMHVDSDKYFPDFTMVIPVNDLQYHPLVDREELRKVIDNVSLFSSRKTNNVRIAIKDGAEEIEVYASSPDKGEGRKSIKVVPGENENSRKFGVNYKYMIETLDSFDSELLTMQVIDTLSPVVMWEPDKPHRIGVVMPMRL